MYADYVIVGAGSAGCALAYRLAEAGRRVTVIEHGGSDAGPFIQMPGALSYPMNMGIYDWGFATEPEPHLGGRVLDVRRPGGGYFSYPFCARENHAFPLFWRASNCWNEALARFQGVSSLCR